jgi:hypothetical protein
MDYFIQIRDGAPYQHPIAADNLCDAFPDIDLDNLPPEFARFERIDPAGISRKPYEVFVENYVMADGAVRDNWVLQEVSPEEKAALREDVIAAVHPDGWLFNEEWFCWEPDLGAPGEPPGVDG